MQRKSQEGERGFLKVKKNLKSGKVSSQNDALRTEVPNRSRLEEKALIRKKRKRET